jgi:replicative DNA helicase
VRTPDSTGAVAVLPHSTEAEQALLGSLLIDATAWAQVGAAIRSEDFHRPDHRLIFEVLSELAARNRPMDVVTVSHQLERRKLLEDAGGLAYLSELARDTPTAANVGAYAKLVRDAAALRSLARFGVDLERQVADSRGREAAEILAAAMRQLIELQTSARTTGGLVAVAQLSRELIDDLDRRREHQVGLQTGLADLDALTAGLEPGDLAVIAARPGMGKTSLLVSIAAHVAKAAAVAVFSAEMPAQQLMRRCVALLGGISQTKLRRPEKLTGEDWDAIGPAATVVADRRLWIDETPQPALAHIRAESFALKARAGLGLVLVDYVQLVRGAGRNRYEELRDVAYGLKALAKDLQVPILALAQLNRGVESRDHKRPHASDLRDSGAIEEAADIIGLLYSEGYYDPGFTMRDVLECAIAKNRNGERGECLWRFSGARSEVTVLDADTAAQYRRLRSQASSQRNGGFSDDL